MLLLASLPLVALALALEEDLRRLPQRLPQRLTCDALDPETQNPLPWSISNPSLLLYSPPPPSFSKEQT